MKRHLVIDIDSDREMEQVKVGAVNIADGQAIRFNPALDMGCCLAAVCILIRVCENERIMSKDVALEGCIEFLKQHYDKHDMTEAFHSIVITSMTSKNPLLLCPKCKSNNLKFRGIIWNCEDCGCRW